ncbi:hypothetical protein glysoja_001479 [Glycine soja]|nr:hypothetical protein glysoja_001479 [Glycine soja]
MGESANEGVFDWVFSDPNVIKAASIIGRVLDDMGSHTSLNSKEYMLPQPSTVARSNMTFHKQRPITLFIMMLKIVGRL